MAERAATVARSNAATEATATMDGSAAAVNCQPRKICDLDRGRTVVAYADVAGLLTR
jgi:hypothetical protein